MARKIAESKEIDKWKWQKGFEETRESRTNGPNLPAFVKLRGRNQIWRSRWAMDSLTTNCVTSPELGRNCPHVVVEIGGRSCNWRSISRSTIIMDTLHWKIIKVVGQDEEAHAKPFMWLNGAAGCVKSAISQSTIELCLQRGLLLDGFSSAEQIPVDITQDFSRKFYPQ
ncbi:hypothetical protein CPC08DRAFT_799665 [Agrocybe pediades]|nr:hypothetical protein CPC08DRAFT_799665 [Agrocybe pediades]